MIDLSPLSKWRQVNIWTEKYNVTDKTLMIHKTSVSDTWHLMSFTFYCVSSSHFTSFKSLWTVKDLSCTVPSVPSFSFMAWTRDGSLKTLELMGPVLCSSCLSRRAPNHRNVGAVWWGGKGGGATNTCLGAFLLKHEEHILNQRV